MQAQRTVKLWVGNRLDGEIDCDPDVLAAEFVQAAVSGFELPQRGSLEFGYRWWLADPKGRNSVWEESDWDTLVEALSNHLGACGDPTKRILWQKVGG